MFGFFVESFLISEEVLEALDTELAPLGEVWLLDCWSSLVGEPVSLLWPLLKDDSCPKYKIIVKKVQI